MSKYNGNEHMLELFLFETFQNIEQLEGCILDTEKSGCYTQDAINEIFRIMHTVKGSSAMMLINNIASLAHTMEDLFYFIREQKPQQIDSASLSDLLLEGVDFIKIELQKIKNGNSADGNCSIILASINELLSCLKQTNNVNVETTKILTDNNKQFFISPKISDPIQYSNFFKATLFFEDGCEMENIRAYSIIHNIKQLTNEVYYIPSDIIDNDDCVQVIREQGFTVYVKINKTYQEMNEFFQQTIFLKDLELKELEDDKEFLQFTQLKHETIVEDIIKIPQSNFASTNQTIISVNVAKLDKLMDLVGEMVISESLVTQNPDLSGLVLDNFQKAARQLHKITSELQDIVMSIRMVPLSPSFQKMHRVVRDMNKKLNKEVQLELIGEETEVDKNIIEHISDPLMHLVRNSIDHGIETAVGREAAGKAKVGKVTLEAKNVGSDVLIVVKDDGRGLNKEKIIARARENGLLYKLEGEMTDREIYNLIFLPGFSTNDKVSEFSGRGVGMDVVTKNIEKIGGSASLDSVEGVGTTITLKIPLTLAIIDGMNIKVGRSRYTIPITAIKESFKPKKGDVITDPDGNEMIMVRGKCYPILRLHRFHNIETDIVDFWDGIFIMVEQDGNHFCIFADELIGKQQVVVKALPDYLLNLRKIRGLAGCTLLGDGSISLILDIVSLK